MANKGSRSGPDLQAAVPSDFPQGTPRDLYPTSDIRFVMIEVGKLTANVDRLIADVKSQGTKLDDIGHKISFLKGAMWAGGILITIVLGIATFVLNSRWNALLHALKVAVLPH